MNREFYEKDKNNCNIFIDIELSEQQIKEGEIYDARRALSDIREKYNLYINE